MTKKQKNSGFTILELIIAVAIAVIISSLAIVGTSRFIAEKKFENEVVSLWKELSAIRPTSLKSETCYFVKFNADNNTYKIYADKVTDCVLNEANDSLCFNGLVANIDIGLPMGMTRSGPDNTELPVESIEGDWKDYLKITSDNLGTINSGRIFLITESIKDMCYCIQVKENTQVIKLFKWNNNGWNEL